MVRYSISNTTGCRTLFRGMALVLFVSLASCIQGYAQTEKESLSHGANGILRLFLPNVKGREQLILLSPKTSKTKLA